MNIEKLFYIVFRSKKSKVHSTSGKPMGQPIFNVRECKYPCVMLTETLSIDKNVDHVTSSFLEQFDSLFYKFNYVDKIKS